MEFFFLCPSKDEASLMCLSFLRSALSLLCSSGKESVADESGTLSTFITMVLSQIYDS